MNPKFDEYKQDMNTLHYTAEQKARLASAAARRAELESVHPIRSCRPVRRTLLIAAALAAVLIITASAAGLLRSIAEVFAPLFGISSAQTEVMGMIGSPIGVSVTDNDVTVTADAIIGDKYCAYIAFTIEGNGFSEAEALSYEMNCDDSHPWSMSFDTMSSTGAYPFDHDVTWWFLEDNDPTDNKMQFIVYVKGNVDGGKTSVVFKDLVSHDYADLNDVEKWLEEDGVLTESRGKQTTLVEGTWEFSFDTAYEDSTISLSGGQTFEQDDLSFTVDSVEISPLSVRAAFHADSEIPYYDDSEISDRSFAYLDQYCRNVPILLTKTDGTQMDITHWGESKIDDVTNGKTYSHQLIVWNEVIPLDQVKSITVGSIEYPISKDTAPSEKQASATDNGITITPQALVSDGQQAHIIYTLEGSEETPLTEIEQQYDEILHNSDPDFRIIGFENSQGQGGYRIADNNVADNKMFLIQDEYMLEELDVPIPGKTYSISTIFENLQLWDGTMQKSVPLVRGHWELNFDMVCEGGSSITLNDVKSFTQSGLSFTVDTLTISAISAHVEYHVNSEMPNAYSNADKQTLTKQSPAYIIDVPFILTKTDGTQIDLNLSGANYYDWSIQPAGQTRCTKDTVFCQMIPLDEIERITIGDAVYEIPHN